MSLDAHTTHCCARHGCKYNDSDCPVKRGILLQKGLCEDCRSMEAGRQSSPKLIFGVVMKQTSEGCDHTIGCGMRFHQLKATTLADALVEAKIYLQGTPNAEDYACGFEDCKLEDEPFGERSRPNLKWAKLLVLQEELPIEAWYQEVLAERVRIQTDRTRAEKLGKTVR